MDVIHDTTDNKVDPLKLAYICLVSSPARYLGSFHILLGLAI